jgi:acetylornithine deacetylase/succinyl-diaminopimelate desuccinylase-like protein
MSVFDAVVNRLDAEAIAADTLRFVEVASPTGEEGPGAAFYRDLLERLGFAPEVVEVPETPGRPNVYARIAGSGGGPGLALNGHVDTIPLGRCVAPRREEEWVWGRGAEDMKGGLVAMAHAAAALRDAGVRLRGDLWLTAVVGHESPVGRKEGPRQMIRDIRAGRLPVEAILIVEGPAKIWAASLGSTIFTIRLESDRGPIHTIHVPYPENPIFWLGRLLAAFERLDTDLAKRPTHPLAGRQLINLGLVQAGDFYNRLPEAVILSGTRRWTPGTTAAEITAEFDAIIEPIAREAGLRYTLELSNAREPFETPVDAPLTRAVRAAGLQLTGAEPEIIGMGLVGDGNLYANEGGVPTVYYGPAYQTAHSDAERVSVRQLHHVAAIYAGTALAFCGA